MNLTAHTSSQDSRNSLLPLYNLVTLRLRFRFKFYMKIRPVFSPSARPLEHGCCDRNSHSCQQHSAQYSIYSAHIHCTFCYRSFLRSYTSFNRSLDQSWSDLASHQSQNPLPTNNLERSLCPRNQSSVFSALVEQGQRSC